jgi:hypothetical protein
MPKQSDRSRKALPLTLPAGAPQWVTIELIEHTIRVWQPFYRDQSIPADALEIIMSVGQMVEVLSSGGDHETVRRVGSREQP